MAEYSGKRALVTGATRGIGKAIALELHRQGCEVIGTGRSFSGLEDGIQFLPLNLSSDQSLNEFCKKVPDLNVDILINNAGINIIEPLCEITPENFQEVQKVNLYSPFRLIQAVSEHMKSQRYGRILNISSIWGEISKPGRASYTASKTGLVGLTRTCALELGEYGVLVNALSPGFTLTELTRASLTDAEMAKLAADIPLKRFAQVEEMARLAAFLCSESNSYLTGQAIVADGGFTIQ